MQESRHLVLATVISVRDGHVTYPCCIQCYSKLFSDCTQNSWRCSKCGTAYKGEELEWRYRLALTITDNKSICSICVFGRLLEPFFGLSASKFYRCYKQLQDNCGDAEEVLMCALKQVFIGKCYYFGLKTQLYKGKQKKPVDLQDIIDSYKQSCTNFTQPENEWKTDHYPDIVAYQMIPAVVTGSVVTVVEVLNDILHPELQSVPDPVQNGSVDFSRIYPDSFSRSKLSHSTKNSQDSFGQSTAILSCDLTNSHSSSSNVGHLVFSFSKNTPRVHENKIKNFANLSELPPLSDDTTNDFHAQGHAETFCDENENSESVSLSVCNENLSTSFSNDTSSLLLCVSQQIHEERNQTQNSEDKLKTSYLEENVNSEHNHRNDVEIKEIPHRPVFVINDRYSANKIKSIETVRENESTDKADYTSNLSPLECEDNFEGNDSSLILELGSQEHLGELIEYGCTDKDGYTTQQIQAHEAGSYFNSDITNTPAGLVKATNDKEVSLSGECFLALPAKRSSDQDEILVAKMFDKTMPDSEDIEEYLNSSECDQVSQNVYEDNSKHIKKTSYGTAECVTNLHLGDAKTDNFNTNSDLEMVRDLSGIASVETSFCLEFKRKSLNSENSNAIESENRSSEPKNMLHRLGNGSSVNKQPTDEINGQVYSPKRLKLQERTLPESDFISQRMDGYDASENVQSQEIPRFKDNTMTSDLRKDTYLKDIDVNDLENIFDDSFNEEMSKIEDNIPLMKHGTSNIQGHLLLKPLDLYKSNIESQIVEEEKLSQLRNISLSDNSMLKVDKDDVEQSEASCLGMEICHVVQEDKLSHFENISSNNNVIRIEDVSLGEDCCFGDGSADLFALSDVSNYSSKNMCAGRSKNNDSNCLKTSKAENEDCRLSQFVLDETENISLCSNSSIGCFKGKSQLLNENTDVSQPSSTGCFKGKSQLLNETTDVSQPCRRHVLKEQLDHSVQDLDNNEVGDVSQKINFKSVQFARRLSTYKSVQLIDLQMKLKQNSVPVISEYQIKSCLKEPVISNGSNNHQNIVLPLQNLKLNSSQEAIFLSQDLFTPSPVNKTIDKDKENHYPKNKINSKKRQSYSVRVSTPKSALTSLCVNNSALQSGSEPLFSDSCDNCSFSNPENQTSLSRSLIMDTKSNNSPRIIPLENSVKWTEQNGNDIDSPCLFSQSEDLFSETKDRLCIKQYKTNSVTDSCYSEKVNSVMFTSNQGNHKELLINNSVEFSPDLFNSDSESELPLSVPGIKSSVKSFPVKRLFLDH